MNKEMLLYTVRFIGNIAGKAVELAITIPSDNGLSNAYAEYQADVAAEAVYNAEFVKLVSVESRTPKGSEWEYVYS